MTTTPTPTLSDPLATLAVIEAAGHQFFRVTFVKRTDGTVRTMTCRRHVSKGVKGILAPGVRREQDAANACLTVFEVPTGGFKRVPLDGILEIVAAGEAHEFNAAA